MWFAYYFRRELEVKAVIVAATLTGAALALALRAIARGLRAASAQGSQASVSADISREGGPDERGDATRAELYEEAKRRGIRGRSKMTKAELQAALAEGARR